MEPAGSDSKYGVRDGNLYDLRCTRCLCLYVFAWFWKSRLAFEDLPEHAAMWVANYTTAQVYLNDLGGDSNYANYAQEAERYKSMVLREHLRNQRYSARASGLTWYSALVRHALRVEYAALVLWFKESIWLHML